MGTGYTRNDTANNIADGNVINASDLDGEFDAIQAAFNATTGHSHDGTTGEGPQIGTGGIADLAVTTGKIANDAVTLGTKTSGNYIATGAVSGVGLSGSASAEGATFTVTSNATSANTASTIVARDASGNFSAGQITATGADINGTLTADGLTVSSANPNIDVSDTGTSYASQDFLTNSDAVRATIGVERSSGGGLFVGSSAYAAVFGTASSGSTQFATNNNVRMTIDSSGNVGIGTASPSVALDVQTTASDAFYVTGGRAVFTTASNSNGVVINGIGTPANYYFDIRDDGATGIFRVDPSGNVGIGTASPATALEVSTTSPVIRSTHSTSGDYLQLFHNGSGAYIDFSADPLIIRGASNAERMRIDSSGNVGIGTSSPSYKLHVDKGGNGVAAKIGNSTSGGSIYIYAGSTGAYVAGDASANDSILFDSTNHLLQFYTNTGTEKMRIDSSGNVGIGTASPSSFTTYNDSKLVVGTGTGPNGITIYTGSTSQGGIFFADGTSGASTYAGILRYNHSDNAMLFFTNGLNERMRIDSSGNLLVGNTSNTTSQAGVYLNSNGRFFATHSGSSSIFNRLSTDGDILLFQKDTSTVGSIQTSSGKLGVISQASNLEFGQSGSVSAALDGSQFYPITDNTRSLGASSARWSNLYLAGEVQAQFFTGNGDTDTYMDISSNPANTIKFYTGGSERARVDASGNLLVGKTANGIANTGNEFAASGYAYHTRSGGITLYCNRLTSDGGIAQFRKDSVSIGEIGVDGGDNLYLTGQTGNTGGIYMNDAAVSPAYQGAERDAYYDLGKGAARWKDLYLSGQANVGTAVASTQTASVTGSTTLDFSTYQNFILTMTGNITLAQPSTEQAGQSGFIIFIHSGAARTVSLGADYETAGAAGLTLSSTSGAVDLVPYVVQSSGNILLGAPQLAFS